MNSDFKSRPQFPSIFGVVCVFVVFGWIGMLVAWLLNVETESGIGAIAITSGLLGDAIAVKVYRSLAPASQRTARRVLWTLFITSFGFVFGGIPGSYIGSMIHEDFGEFIGWLVTASLGVLVAASWGWYYSPRLERDALEANCGRASDGQE